MSYLGIFLTIFVILQIFVSKSHGKILASLVAISLFNVPLLMLGNSASAGIFPVDLILPFIYLKFYFLSFGRLKHFPIIGNPGLYPFSILVFWAILRGFFVLVFEDYQSYDKFVVYGMYRWIFIVLLFTAYLNKTSEAEDYSMHSHLVVFLCLYFVGAVLHQSGFVDLSGWSSVGSERLYRNDYMSRDVFRAYLGGHASVVGCVSVFGVLYGLYTQVSKIPFSKILLVLSIASLFGSGSVSDLIGLFVAIVVWWLFHLRSRFAMRVIVYVIAISIPVLVYISLSEVYGLQKLLGTNILSEAKGESSGTFAYRMFWWGKIMNHLNGDLYHFFLGYGPNGFRMLSVLGVSQMGYGHNLYLHTVGELGLIGLLLLIWFIVSVLVYMFRQSVYWQKRDRYISSLCILLLVQRVFSGISVDSVFAVDNMIPVTSVVLYFLSLAYKRKSSEQRIPNSRGSR